MKKLLLLLACSVFSLSGFSQCFNGWSYYEPVTITNSNPSTTDAEVAITMNTAALISAGKMNVDGSDIRFVQDLACCTALPHYVESGINTASTTIWVKVPTLAAGPTTIYILYGNSAAVDAADPENVFALWEGFDSAPYDFTLSCGSGSATASGGQMTYSWSSNAQWVSNTTFPVADVYTAEANVTAHSGNWPGLYWANETSQKSYGTLYGSNAVRISVSGTSSTFCAGHNWASSVFSAPTTAGIWSFTWIATGNQIGYHPGYGNLSSTNTLWLRNENQKLTLGGISGGTGSYTIDWVRARKYLPVAPTASFGAELAYIPTAISYTGTLCAGTGTATPTFAGLVTGTYSASGGVTINPTTGVIDLSSTSGGSHTITFTASSVVCPTPTTTNIVVTEPTGAIAVSGSNPICAGQSSEITFTGQPNTVINYDSSGYNSQSITLDGAGQAMFTTPALDESVTYNLINATLSGCTAGLTGNATVTVNPAPTATLSNNGSATVCNGASTSIDIDFTGTAPYDFTYFDGNIMQTETGFTGSTFNFSVTPTVNTTYFVTTLTDANLCSGTINNNASVSVEAAPAITTDPASTTPCTGAATSFSVAATGGGLGYQWYNGVTPLTNTAPYSGADADELNVNDVSGLDGSTFYVEVSNTCGSINSATATLTENFENTWVGGAGTPWSNTSNWSCGTLPTILTNVTVPSTAATMPNVNILTAMCNNITIDAGALITFSSFNAQLEVAGDITNNGEFSDVTGKLLLSGTDQQLTGPIRIGHLEIDGGGNKTLGGDFYVTDVLTYTDGYIVTGAYDLILDAPWEQNGAGTNSFVVTNDTGSVFAKNLGNDSNPESTWFHVGINTGSYTPLFLENTGDQDSFKVRVMEHVFLDGTGDDPAQVDNPVVDRTWMISEYNPGGSVGEITPYWNAGDETTNFDLGHVYIAHYENDEWTSNIDSAIFAPAADGTDPYSTTDTFYSFSPFTVASYAQFPLAIRLTTINAVNAGSRNKVEWRSAKEDAGDHFELERSATGEHFTQIAKVDANGKPSSYTHWDETPVIGENYYRVKLVSADGKATYSKVVSVTVGKEGDFSIEAYPNPIKNTVSVKVNGVINGTGNLVVTDVTGRVVATATQVVDNKADINLGNLPSGMYLLNYSDDVRNESIKINKQ